MHPLMRFISYGRVLLPATQPTCPGVQAASRWPTLQKYFMTPACFSLQATSLNTQQERGSWTCPKRKIHLGICHQQSVHNSPKLQTYRLWHSGADSISSNSSSRLLSDHLRYRATGLNGLGSRPLKVSYEQLGTSAQKCQITDESKPQSRIGAWWQHHRNEMRSAPSAAIALGFSGLVPFLVPAIYSLVTMSCGPNIAFAQAAYGACILSFLGGVRWGYAIAPDGAPTWPALIFSVLPSLVAWTGLMMPIQPGLFCIIVGLASAGIADAYFKAYPLWFRSLRFILTTFAIISISVTFTLSIIFPPPEPEHGYNFRKLIKIAQIIVED